MTMPLLVVLAAGVLPHARASGLAGHLAGAHLPWGLALVVTAAAVAGSLLGARLAGRFRDDVLRTAFGWFVAALGAVVLARQLPVPVIVTVAATAVVLCLRRRSSPPSRVS